MRVDCPTTIVSSGTEKVFHFCGARRSGSTGAKTRSGQASAQYLATTLISRCRRNMIVFFLRVNFVFFFTLSPTKATKSQTTMIRGRLRSSEGADHADPEAENPGS